MDEYYPLEAGSNQSYQQYMNYNFFSHINIKQSNCYIPKSDLAQEDVKQHCEAYEKKIEALGGIDFQLLGIGRNGHIGFNEPGSQVNSCTRLITLDPITRFDAAYDFDSMNNVPRKAITMGVGTILKTKRIVLVALGESKTPIIKKAVDGPVTEFIPASYLQGHNNAAFILDEAYASELTRIKIPWLTDEVTWDAKMIKKAVCNLAITIDKPILKLTANDYNENGLSDLPASYRQVHDLNIEILNQLQHTITGWPGGKPDADDSHRPERALPAKKRVLIFSPHPDDDIISMGGTFQRLVYHGHEVHVAYQTSGNIAVADDEAFRFIEFVKDYNSQFNIKSPKADIIYDEALLFLKTKKDGEKDTAELRYVKGLLRRGEEKNTCRFVGIPAENAHFLNLPFYETDAIEKSPIDEEDFKIIEAVIEKVKPHQIYAAGDLADPHGTHKVCLDGVFEAVKRLKSTDFMKKSAGFGCIKVPGQNGIYI
ncbi:MAG: PIG-L family deacetylase [Chitinophagaceae bacterium]